MREEFGFWEDASCHGDHSLPLDHAQRRDGSATANCMADAVRYSTALEADATDTLVHKLGSALNAQIGDALLSALATVLCRWSGRGSICFDCEGHGREALFEDTDTSRTVGWLTTVYPVRLEVPDARVSGALLASCKEQIRRIPHNGIGYGLAREMCTDPAIAGVLRNAPNRELCFNYLGQLDATTNADALFRLQTTTCGTARSPRGSRAYLIDVNAKLSGGRLIVEWIYNGKLHHAATVTQLARDYLATLGDIAALCRTGDGAAVSPSDFPLAGLDQQGLDGLAALLGDDDE